MNTQTSRNPKRGHLRVGPNIDSIGDRSEEDVPGQNYALYHLLVEHSSDLISRHTLGGTFLFASPACVSLLGYSPEELVDRNAYDFIHPEDHSYIRKIHLAALSVPGTHWATYRFQRKTGDYIWFESTAQIIRHPETDAPQEIVAVSRDCTERKNADEQLREQAALLDQTQDAIIVRDLEDRIVFWNRGAERLYGVESRVAMGSNIYRLLTQKELNCSFGEASKALADHGEWVGELHQATTAGREIIVESRCRLMRDVSGQPKGVLMVNTNVTDKKRLELQFLRKQRLESIGRLASGIAHNLGNVLSPILIAIHLLQQKCFDTESQEWLEVLRTNAEHGGRMITQLLSFARGVESGRVPIRIDYLIRELSDVLVNTFPKSIEIKTAIPNGLWSIMGDATHLHQVLMNLCVNARDAMQKGGRLCLEARNVVVDETYARMHPEATPGRYLMIEVSDTGVGIPAEIIDRIFDPFFTTKRGENATGLGLSTVLGIVKGHKGFIDVSSETGKGTTFRVHLPALSDPVDEVASFGTDDLSLGQGELVLVADDEAAIREITKETLETSGYHVILANDAAEVIALCAENRSQIRVVLLDMDLADLDGPSVVRILKKLAPQIRIIVTGGHIHHQLRTTNNGADIARVLLKPYTAERLLKTLAQVLGAQWEADLD
jgi:PAS domain S-box-containing protein